MTLTVLTDADILAARSPKKRLDPCTPYDYLFEWECAANGLEEPVATIFLTNKECPFRCTMCDLWKYTLDERVPVGAIPAQIRLALNDLPPARHIKLYNAGNFFDAQAIPPEDHEAIAALVSQFDTVIVENHPRLTDERCVNFRDLLVASSLVRTEFNSSCVARSEQSDGPESFVSGPSRSSDPATQPTDADRPTVDDRISNVSGKALAAGSIEVPAASAWPLRKPRSSRDSTLNHVAPRLEVALGLETVHPEVLSKLNKRMTVEDFDRAATFLRDHDINVRAFVLLKPPGLNEREGIEWALKSVAHAFEVGVGCCSVIPTRAGNGIMDRLLTSGEFLPPTLASLEETLERGIELAKAAGSTCRVFVDLWDAERFGNCPQCTSKRIARLHTMNLSQQAESSIRCNCLK